MADDDTTMFQRQSASDLLWGMSHRKAIAHAVPQVRLARQLEAAIPPSPALGQLLSPDRVSPLAFPLTLKSGQVIETVGDAASYFAR